VELEKEKLCINETFSKFSSKSYEYDGYLQISKYFGILEIFLFFILSKS
jgi:hypothetical protein